jgi:CheY-like chemotaxis protein
MDLTGMRVLLVEDEGMIAMLIRSMLTSIGCDVVGIASRVPDALRKVEVLSYDVALLDVNLAGTLSYPVAAALRIRGIPFLFATGYGEASLPADMREIPVLSKPFIATDLQSALLTLPRPSSCSTTDEPVRA